MVTPGKTYVADKLALRLDGADMGLLQSADGGWVSAPVVAEPASGSSFVSKRLGPPVCEPLVLRFDLTLAPPMYAWIAAWWRGQATPRDCTVETLDLDLTRRSARHFPAARLAELTVPALNRASKQPCAFTLTLASTTARATAVSGRAPDPAAVAVQRRWLACNFRLEIPGLDCTQVRAVDPFTVRPAPSGPLDFPTLRVTLSEKSAGSWWSWHEDFVVRGNNGPGRERSGALNLLSPDQRDLARISLVNLGIVRLARLPADDTAVRSVVADLYCERMELSVTVATG